MAKDRTFSAITLRAVDGVDITNSYSNLGSALTEPIYMMTLKNTTDIIVLISENASDVHYELAPGESEFLDLQTNKFDGTGAKKCGLQFSVKSNNGSSATCGRVILQGQTL